MTRCSLQTSATLSRSDAADHAIVVRSAEEVTRRRKVRDERRSEGLRTTDD
jgi:hypothetical protein